MTARELRTERERTLFAIAAVVSTMAWVALVLSIVGIFYGAAFALFALAAHALFLAHVSLNGVRLGPDQLPELHARVVRASRALGLPRAPEAFVLQGNGLLNAFATKLLSRRCVVILADLIEAAEAATPADAAPGTPDVMDFVVAHEVGHVAAGHLAWNAFLLPARACPWLGPAYSRACEYTTDWCGLEVTGNLETASRALAVLAAGASGRRVALDAFTRQREAAGGFWPSVLELNSTHPFLPKRIAALEEWVKPGTHRAVGRNILAYPLAPLFGLLTGGTAASSLLVIVAVIGIMAAIAVPNLLVAIDRGKTKRTMVDLRRLAIASEAYATDYNKYPAATSVDELLSTLQPTYGKDLAGRDGWGHPLRYWVRAGGNGYALASAGADGKWEHIDDDPDAYTRGETTTRGADIVYANGSFVRYPATAAADAK